MRFSRTTFVKAGLLAGMLLPTLPAMAQVVDDEDEIVLEELVVTGVKVTQGGAQDIRHFRQKVRRNGIPHPETFTAEGLLSEHDLTLVSTQKCEKLFCLTGDVRRADLIAAPGSDWFIGLGFASDLDPETWKRDPVHLVAVVDKSGSMDGEPLDLVRHTLSAMTEKMGPEDQLSIVLYGSNVTLHLSPTRLTRKNRSAVRQRIADIESFGSTDMESGLKLGYRIANEAAENFSGKTRVMLFTDERPNVGATDEQSFMGMAQSASQKGIGLTTIGVGTHFGADLATSISSVRGGNLFFIDNRKTIRKMVAEDFDYMVSELAHDLTLTITPAEGYRISGVYGVPDKQLGWQKERSVSLTIPTVFLSNRGGGLFVTLAREGENRHLPMRDLKADESLLSVDLMWREQDQPLRSDSLVVRQGSGENSKTMLLAHRLIDEYTTLHAVTSAHHLENDQEKAWQLIHRLAGKTADKDNPWPEQERQLVGGLHSQLAFLSGHAGEVNVGKEYRYLGLTGTWKITRISGMGSTDLKRGDQVDFARGDRFSVYRRKGGQLTLDRDEDVEMYEATGDQLWLEDSGLMLDYYLTGDRLRLKHMDTGTQIILKRVVES